MRLQRLLHPRSIAFVGGSECAIAIERTRALGFEGRIWAVNPRRPRLGGVPTVASVADIDGSPDAAFIALPRALTPDAVAALRALDCGGAVIYAAGFAETGDRGRQDALLAAADGMPLLGPNCYGFINTTSRAALWPDEHALAPVERGVALVTQSGNIGCNLTMMRRGLPVAALLTLGNQADVDIAAAVDAFAGVLTRFGKVRMVGSAAASLLHVATGQADAYVEHRIMPWDVAAGLAILQGAGGGFEMSFTEFDEPCSVVATNGRFAPDVAMLGALLD